MSGTGQEDNTQQSEQNTADATQQQQDTTPATETAEPASAFDKFVDDTSRPTPTDRATPQAPAQQATQTPAQTPQQATGVPHERGLRRMQNGDLVNADGQVVARAGTESRHWQRANDAAREIGTLRAQVNELNAANEAFRTAASTFTALGLQPQEMTAAANLMANWKTNPPAVIKYLLTEAQAAGHDLSSILGAAAAGIDPNAIRRIIRDEVAPLTQAQQEQHRVAEAHSSAAREYNEFAQQYPEALVQEAEIATLMQRFPELSAEAAHLRLHNYALQNGYDYSQPLRPQMEARRGGVQAPTNQAPQPANRSVLPGTRVSASNGMTDMRTAAAPASMSTRDIVAEALRESGIVLQ